MEQIINEIYTEVKNICMQPTNAYGIGAWDHHIEFVYKIATKNCDLYGANYDVVALSALLHDVASVTNKDFTEEHHIIGTQIAEKILEKYELDPVMLGQIKNCILNHRGSIIKEKTSPEEICIADSDAMAHFYSVPSLLKMVYVEKGMPIDDGSEFVLNKLERSFNKLSDMGKQRVSEQYESVKLLLKKY